ncbi:uncharacterized protein LOC124154353 isoform X3 [Ischnura elegans]|nr:uncharacterized protein LOC124154353 isoform X3 [Ischnura elegans]
MVNQVLATVVSDDDSVEREREVHAEATYLWPCIQHEIPDEDPKAENGTTNRISQFCGRQDIIVDCLRERSDNLTRTFDNATDTGVFMRDMLTRLVSFACDNDAEMLRAMAASDNGNCFMDNISFCQDNSTVPSTFPTALNCNEGDEPKTVEGACCQILRIFECTEKEMTSCQGDELRVLTAAKKALKNEEPCKEYYGEAESE